MANLPTGTVTFLFTDIEGSTNLLERLGDRLYAEVLDKHRRLLRDLFTEENGQEFDTPGDAFLAVFSRARDAVGAAVSAQQALSTYSWPDGISLRVRMGLHTGEPVSESRNYVGLDVHRAARICAAGHGGQILLSQTVGVLVAHDLPQKVSLRDLGPHRLKDLREPEHLFQVVHPDLTFNFPPLDSLDARPNNLPTELTSFVGREREMADIRRLLSTTRHLTLTGSGGVGKTRLALHVAAEVLEEFPDGVWLVELAALSDPSLVPRAVASALDVPEQPGRVLTQTLTDSLRAKSALVVLDNCEHLVAACAHLTNVLLRACPNLRILATSRETLGVAGETTWQVPSLTFPDPEHLPPLERFKEYEAIRLFMDRAVSSAPQFAVTSRNAPAVAQICHQLDGVPLAIELAAARVKVLAVEQIAARLEDRFRLLKGGGRTSLPRHQTLRTAMDWSYDLLSDQERLLVRRLSVFAGGWTLEAAEAVCAGDGIEAGDVLDLLVQLVDKSLVSVETAGGQARYRLLQTTRQYARDRLRETGKGANMHERHRDYYMGLAERIQGELQGPEQTAHLQRLETEHDNFRAALVWSEAEESGAEKGLRLATALLQFWHVHGHLSEGRRWLESMLSHARTAPVSIRAHGLFSAGFLAQSQGDHIGSTPLYAKSAALFRELGDVSGDALALRILGMIAQDQGDFERAKALFMQSLTLFRDVGDKRWMAAVLNDLGEVGRNQGNCVDAEAAYEESVALRREVGNTKGLAISLANSGLLALDRGYTARAEGFFTEALALAQELAFKLIVAVCLTGLAEVAAAEGQPARAGQLLGAADRLRDSLGSRPERHDRLQYERAIAASRAALGEAAFAEASKEGRAMTLEQAVEYALQGDSDGCA